MTGEPRPPEMNGCYVHCGEGEEGEHCGRDSQPRPSEGGQPQATDRRESMGADTEEDESAEAGPACGKVQRVKCKQSGKSLPRTAIRKSESQYILGEDIGLFPVMVSELTGREMH